MATLEYYDIILKPIQTERMFEGTKVARVNTVNCRPKKKRRGMVYGQTAKRKKAYVTLTADSKEINLFTGL